MWFNDLIILTYENRDELVPNKVAKNPAWIPTSAIKRDALTTYNNQTNTYPSSQPNGNGSVVASSSHSSSTAPTVYGHNKHVVDHVTGSSGANNHHSHHHNNHNHTNNHHHPHHHYNQFQQSTQSANSQSSHQHHHQQQQQQFVNNNHQSQYQPQQQPQITAATTVTAVTTSNSNHNSNNNNNNQYSQHRSSPKPYVAPSRAAVNAIDEDEEVFRKARGILNKLTPEKFDKLSYDFCTLSIRNTKVLKGIILLVSVLVFCIVLVCLKRESKRASLFIYFFLCSN